MKLRTLILLSLLVFGLAPLFAAVSINLPLIFERLELFYHKAHLQNLRADFKDLDQHIASREEMVRLLAKLPEPGAVLGDLDQQDAHSIDLARARYTEWINQILQEQLDITQLVFLDKIGQERFWLERNRDTGKWEPTVQLPDRPSAALFQTAMRMDRSGVLIGPIRLRPGTGATDPRKFMTLHLISPIGENINNQWQSMGAVLMSIDVGGMARAYRDTLWVNNDGTYLLPLTPGHTTNRAFDDFPGLETTFTEGKLDLWESKDSQIIWVPMFATENNEPLWVGRRVDQSPVSAFRNALTARVLTIVFALIVLVWVLARWFAVKIEHFGKDLTDGIARVLEKNDPVVFSWQGANELRTLGNNLTQLSQTHAEHIRSLRDHARALEQSNKYKSEFLANVSHELKTPLNSILLLSKLLSDEKSGIAGDQVRQAEVIYKAGSDLKALIDNILDLSRMEAGQATIRSESIDLRRMIAGLKELLQPQFEEKGLHLTIDYADEVPQFIVSDQEKLRQILKNFLSNSIKFTHQGGVAIRVARNTTGDAATRPICISVQDTGIGIPLDKQALVFEAFKQADGSTSRRYGGTGLGLTISRELAGLIGGRIDLDSRENQGATFFLCLPLKLDQDQITEEPNTIPASIPEDDARELTVPQAQYDDQCVLLIESDVQTLLQVTPLLERWGLRVTAAGDGAEALEALEDDKDECSLVFVDAMMPQVDGYDTIKILRNAAGQTGINVIALIGHEDETTRAWIRSAGYDEFLIKPVDPKRLQELLDRYLGRPEQ